MALDDQRLLETVKLCIDYLKHLTTLSSAGTVVVLTLIDRPGTNTTALVFPVLLFGLATIICVVGMYFLISDFASWDIIDKRAAGVTMVGFVAWLFSTALLALILGAFVPDINVRLIILGGLTLVLLPLAIAVYLFQKYKNIAVASCIPLTGPNEPHRRQCRACQGVLCKILYPNFREFLF
jgi:MFS family permease